MSESGHNSGSVAADRLKSFIDRIERLIEERAAIQADIKDVYSEAKGVGYDVATMRKVVQLRKLDDADRKEQESLLAVYMHALGMVDRIDARLAAGQSQRSIAEAEGTSKSTVQRRGPKMQSAGVTSKNGPPHDPTTGEIIQEVDTPGVDAGLRSEPSPAAEQSGTYSQTAAGAEIAMQELSDIAQANGMHQTAASPPPAAEEAPGVTRPAGTSAAHPPLAQKMLGTFKPVDDATALANLDEAEAEYFASRKRLPAGATA